MPYIVNFTDKENKVPITVYDNTSNTDTSLTFPGRNVTGYGQTVAENFLSLLENFASPDEPNNPVEGQLWFNTINRTLQIFDGSTWKAASDIQKSVTAPTVEESKVGELWVDTVNQQLYLFSGIDWILVGPTFSSGTKSGPLIESIIDTENSTKTILIFYLSGIPVVIISKENFTPKNAISGFSTIKTGVNLTLANSLGSEAGKTKLHGTATSADSLNVSGVAIESGKFMRTDTVNNTDYGINIRNNSGITIGSDSTFALSNSLTSAKIYNKTSGSSIDFQLNIDNSAKTIMRLIDGKIAVGINNTSPTEVLDVLGNIKTNGQLIVTGTTESTNINNGSIRTAGGVSISKNLIVGTTLDVQGNTTLRGVEPSGNALYELGSAVRKWKTVHADKVIATTFEGTILGNITGNAVSATSLQNATTFNITGDVISTSPVTFNGSTGGYNKTFTTTLSSNIISGKSQPIPNVSRSDDYVLVYRTGTSDLLKESRDVFVGDLGVPIGTLLPYAGSTVPYGYLLCDGSEVEKAKYPSLYDVIGTIYNGSTALVGANTFRIPDLRSRFALGRDNMDNSITVPNSLGTYVDAGGGHADRIPDVEADTLGGVQGSHEKTIAITNLPQHTHNMINADDQFYAVRVDTAVPAAPAILSQGPTATNGFQYLPNTGNVNADVVGQAMSVMNPYITLNYIIRSGPPAF